MTTFDRSASRLVDILAPPLALQASQTLSHGDPRREAPDAQLFVGCSKPESAHVAQSGGHATSCFQRFSRSRSVSTNSSNGTEIPQTDLVSPGCACPMDTPSQVAMASRVTPLVPPKILLEGVDEVIVSNAEEITYCGID
ncbi:hypothetical protein NFI96_003908 [Prochilodus magdalenae]|nr:hypothetical protein NFI96_003908 [Prochilodus magdalenae]